MGAIFRLRSLLFLKYSACRITSTCSRKLSQVNIPTLKLNNGNEIPVLGYGTWAGLDDKGDDYLEGEFMTGEIPKIKEAMAFAIDVGYRHIDTAHLYRVEPEVGEVVAVKIKENVVKREELFITTKVWQHMHSPENVEISVRASLKRANLKYFDLVLMHWPMSISDEGVDEKIDYLVSWKGFETVLEKGLVKAIGVSNFNVEQLKRLIANSKVVPATNQVEINLTHGQPELVDYCQSQGIVIVAYSPFGAMVPTRAYEGTPEPKLNNPTMVAIAEKHKKTVSQVALRYMFQRGIALLPKTVTKSRVVENASIFDFNLDDEDFATIAKFDVNFRLVRPVFWEPYENYPFDKTGTEARIPLAFRKWKNGAAGNID